MAIKLLNAHVMVKPDKPINELNGVHLPDNLVKKASVGTVIEVGRFITGNGVELEVNIHPNDRVQYRPYDGEPIEVDGQVFLLLTIPQIVGVLDSERTY